MLTIQIKPESVQKAHDLLERNPEIDPQDFEWVDEENIEIPDHPDYHEVWNQIMILFESEDIQIV